MTTHPPELAALIERASGAAAEIFCEAGEVLAMYHVVLRDGRELVLPAPPGPKDLGIRIMRAAFAALDVTRYVFIDEAWMLDGGVAAADLARVQREGIRAQPGRIEVLMFGAEGASGMLLARRRILRPEGAKPELAALDFFSMGDGVALSGRMIGLLPARGTRQ
jgi:hypothetical protein